MLCLSGELTSIPSFEFALRERVSRLSSFRHTSYGRVRSVDRLSDSGSTLALVSVPTPGVRLSDILALAEREKIPLDINAALCLIRQLVPAVALMHEHAKEIAHGALGPERLVVTPQAHLVIVEYVMGAALEQLRFSHSRYWKELRIALPRSAGLPHFDHRADVTQLGVVALSLILGRPLHEDEYPGQVRELLASAWAISARGDLEPLTPGLRSWLARALQLDLRDAFPSAIEALAALDEVLSGDSR
jgi:serine/threonine protein kinase